MSLVLRYSDADKMIRSYGEDLPGLLVVQSDPTEGFCFVVTTQHQALPTEEVLKGRRVAATAIATNSKTDTEVDLSEVIDGCATEGDLIQVAMCGAMLVRVVGQGVQNPDHLDVALKATLFAIEVRDAVLAEIRQRREAQTT